MPPSLVLAGVRESTSFLMKGEGEAKYLPTGQQLRVPPVLFYRPGRGVPGVVAGRGHGQSQLSCLLPSPEGGFWHGLFSLSLGRLKVSLPQPCTPTANVGTAGEVPSDILVNI